MNRLLYVVTIICVIVSFVGCKKDHPADISVIQKKESPSDAPEFPPELVDFIPYEHNPVFAGTGKNSWDNTIRERGYILREGDSWYMWYTGYNDELSDTKYLGYATSPDGFNWTRYSDNPIFDRSWVEDMQVIKYNGIYYLFAEGRNDIAHMMTSTDRIHWEDHGKLDIRTASGDPLSPGPYGTPTVFIEDGMWYLFYERNDDGVWLATSSDRVVWTNVRDDPVIAKGPDSYDSEAVAVNQVIKHDGRYYACYHACAHQPWRDWTTNIAVSTDLVHWKKYPGNPIVSGDKSSGLFVHDGEQYLLFTMHPDVRVYFPERNMQMKKVTAPGAHIEKLTGGFTFSEGPACDSEGNMFFTDIPEQKIYRWSNDGQLSTFLDQSGWANGLYFDSVGNLLACRERGRAVVSIDPRGNVTVLVDRYDNKRLNSANDLWIDAKGGIYFTDPRYELRPDQKKTGPMEQDGEHVYYISPDRKKVIRVIDTLVRPNGITGDPRRNLLYVIDNGAGKTYEYTMNEDGTLSEGRLFASKGGDGMTIDTEGNVYLTTGGVTVFDKHGAEIERIVIDEQTTNVCFGGTDKRTLYITAATSLYSIRMRVRGF